MLQRTTKNKSRSECKSKVEVEISTLLEPDMSTMLLSTFAGTASKSSMP
jgi:hypothetical protein